MSQKKIPPGAEAAVEAVTRLYDEILNTARARFPESKFRTLFAPYFMGEKEIPSNSDFYTAWIGIAGSPQAEVDIVDDKGNVVFTVPSLIDSSIINISGKTHLEDISREAELHYQRLKAEGDKFSNEVMVPEVKKLISGETKAKEKWEKIARYYGYEKKSPNKDQISNNDDSDLDYDI